MDKRNKETKVVDKIKYERYEGDDAWVIIK